ncbi:hypothetical protein MCOR29_004766 [Pyricularia oryzae]|uniref:PH domain-containing protein n=1 Tax=Pyricularia grisea TaxID=148305 RepID=A0ABQ8NGG9_PYRGI|nr:hypothetical protein MCOR26_009701 [Pyricularia oryzae]KAI6296721.1 hypothetical protein MCOR33_006767 [Pyricularia grisea]KAI6322364.1 hypothetical protein MCOR29_004766 [Pyricularia oryzae]KAI6343015.1 hypothetical protein MCOR28_005018 [Pyricularia oryzae]KAI6435190.1 hypothetical protein MCOR21_001863 [Pyricularia oryzae]
MSALTQTYTLQKPPGAMSRYRSLRGKSVSETRSMVESILGGDTGSDKGNGSPIKSAFGSRYRKRAKTINASDVPEVPPPLPSATEMNISMRNSAASVQPLGKKEPNTPTRKSKSPPKKPSTPDLEPASRPSESDTLGDIRDQFPAVPTPTEEMPVATALTADTAVDTASIQGDVPAKLQQTQEQKLLREIERRGLVEEEARLNAETDRILAEQKRKDMERLHSQLRAGSSHGSESSSLQSSPVQPSPVQSKPRSPMLAKFFFRRGRRSDAVTLSPTSSACASVAGDSSRATSLEPQLMPRTFIDPGATAFTFPLRPDSPILNRHGAERSIQVRCRGVRHDVNVTLDTNAVDILFACAVDAPQPFNTCTSVVVESYATLGLERRLRRYERIKDVLNSWDRDTQHHLLVEPSSETFDSHQDLDMSSVPGGEGSMPPPGFVLQMHHSQRPGKWSKRFITLLGNGQLFSCKKADSVLISQQQVGGGSASPALMAAAATSMGATMLCHLIGYDIYTPTETQAKKNLKPPKRFCYAVKSQQKTMEASADNFVHFFATDDPDVARKFHDAVHGWRSWYIVNGRGSRGGSSGGSGGSSSNHREGFVSASRPQHPAREDSLAVNPIPHPSPDQEMQLQQRPTTATGAPQITAVRHKPKKSISHVKVAGGRHRLRVSIDEAPYTIGDFQPLLDLGRFDKPIDDFGKDWVLRASVMPSGAGGVAGAVQTPEGPPEDEFASGHKKVAKGCVSSDVKAAVENAEPVQQPAQPQSPDMAVGQAAPPRTPEIPAETPSSPDTDDSHNHEDTYQTEQSPPSTPPVPSLPKSETKSWFPSASAHTAGQKAKVEVHVHGRAAALRPSTSAGEKRTSTYLSPNEGQVFKSYWGLGNGLSDRLRRPNMPSSASSSTSGNRQRRPPMPHAPHSGLQPQQRLPDAPMRYAPGGGRRPDPSGVGGGGLGVSNSRPPTSDGSSSGRAQGAFGSRGRSNTVGNSGRPPMQPVPPVPPIRGKSAGRPHGPPGVEHWSRGVAGAERERGVRHGGMDGRNGMVRC